MDNFSYDLSKLDSMDAHQLAVFLKQANEYIKEWDASGINKWFIPSGKFTINDYPKHKAFFAAGKDYHERLFMAANRVGKSIAGAYETACHLTGRYPVWWEGRRFDHPVNWWACGKTGQTVRDTVQKELMGEPGKLGSGTIPARDLIKWYQKPGTPNAIEMVEVRHVSGGVSHLTFKSYDQNVQAFYGTARHGIWLDEECPELIYSECLIRTMTTDGIVFVTFTPLHGLTPFIVNFTKNADFLEGATPIIADLGDAEGVHSFRT
jgi:phage terminase large subunit-like protein